MSEVIIPSEGTLVDQADTILTAIRSNGDISEDIGPPRSGDFIISPSQFETWQTCALKWYYYKVEGRPKKPSEAAAIGNAVHDVLDNWNKGATLEDLQAVADLGEIHPVVLNYGFEGEMPYEEMTKQIWSLALGWIRAGHKRADSPEEERTVYLFTTYDGIRVYLTGRIDGQILGGIRPHLIDYKTSGKRWSQKKADEAVQPGFYGIQELILNGAQDIAFTFEVLLKKPPKCTKCKGKNEDPEGCGGSGDFGERCQAGRFYFQHVPISVGPHEMRLGLMKILQMADSVLTLPKQSRYFVAAPGMDAQNCGWCAYVEGCWTRTGRSA